MLKLISIHIPRTGGTSFYQILQQVYGEQLSISYRRKDYRAAVQNDTVFSKTLDKKVTVLHGHFFYKELQQIHQGSNAKIICWLRDPVDRVISNYRHFIYRNSGSDAIRPNQHRINEALLTYARMKQNQNRISQFLEGIELEELFFIGFLESFSKDLDELANLLDWSNFTIPKLNSVQSDKKDIPAEILQEIRALNELDYALYAKALNLAKGRDY